MQTFLDGRVILHSGDCLATLRGLPDDYFDSVVTDPPYALTTGKKGGSGVASLNENSPAGRARVTTGFMGKAWDTGETAFAVEFWAEVWRVLKPGGHVAAFGGTRSYHRLACAIEDAGFEIRDQLAWAYGSGFPKSHDVSKGIDKALGRERAKVRVAPRAQTSGTFCGSSDSRPWIEASRERGFHEAVSDEAVSWQGWGTALKPAWESICLARKPLEFWAEYAIIGSLLEGLEARLWSIVPAKTVAELSASSPLASRAGMFAFAQWNAEASSNTLAALSGAMDTSLFESVLLSSLSTVSSWNAIWGDASEPENTSITETELSATIGLRTLKSLLSKITPASIMLAHKTGSLIANASPAESIFNASVLRLRSTLELSALAFAISQEADNSLDVGAKPLWEPICLARKPLGEKTVAANVLRWGTGAVNVDGCRVETSDADQIAMARVVGFNKSYSNGEASLSFEGGVGGSLHRRDRAEFDATKGRHPANIVHDGSDEVLAGFPREAGGGNGGVRHNSARAVSAAKGAENYHETIGFAASGSAARFFYSAKADASDRIGSKHPTVKPVDLMRWLCRLITPPDGRVLDPFAGTGTTGEAAWREGFRADLCEREAEYLTDIARRMALAGEGPAIRKAESAKARHAGKREDHGPLFGGGKS